MLLSITHIDILFKIPTNKLIPEIIILHGITLNEKQRRLAVWCAGIYA